MKDSSRSVPPRDPAARRVAPAPARPAPGATPPAPQPPAQAAGLPAVLAQAQSRGRGNGVQRQAALLHLQRTVGNQAARRLLQRAAAPPVAVQRAVGLEFQTKAKLYSRPKNQRTPLEYGVRVFEEPGMFHAESDEGELEFVTATFDENEGGLAGLRNAVRGAAEFAGIVRAQAGQQRVPLADIAQAYGQGKYQRQYKGADIQVLADEDVTAWPQATVGVPLDKLVSLLEVLADHQTEAGHRLGGFGQEYRPSEPSTAQATVFKPSAEWGRQQGGSAALAGFRTLIYSYLRGARIRGKDAATDYPKIVHPLMARNNFAQIFLTLPPGDQKALRQQPDLILDIAKEAGMELDQPIYPKGYKRDDDDSVDMKNVPTVRAWLESIIPPEAASSTAPPPADHLSRLPGMPKGRGMGALKRMDTVAKTKENPQGQTAPVFELRRMLGEIPPAQWEELAALVHQTVNRVNGAPNVSGWGAALAEDARRTMLYYSAMHGIGQPGAEETEFPEEETSYH